MGSKWLRSSWNGPQANHSFDRALSRRNRSSCSRRSNSRWRPRSRSVPRGTVPAPHTPSRLQGSGSPRGRAGWRPGTSRTSAVRGALLRDAIESTQHRATSNSPSRRSGALLARAFSTQHPTTRSPTTRQSSRRGCGSYAPGCGFEAPGPPGRPTSKRSTESDPADGVPGPFARRPKTPTRSASSSRRPRRTRPRLPGPPRPDGIGRSQCSSSRSCPRRAARRG